MNREDKKQKFESLISMTKNISYEISNKYGISKGRGGHIDRDDLEQVGLLAAWNCLDRFEENGFTLKTYAYKRVFGAMLDELRKTQILTKKDHYRNTKFDNFHELEEFDKLTSVETNYGNSIDLDKAFKTIKGRDKIILDLYKEGHDINKIGKIIGVSRSRASQILKEIRNRLKETLVA